MEDEETCEYPDCDRVDDLNTYGFTINGQVEHERTYCPEHDIPSTVIDA